MEGVPKAFVILVAIMEVNVRINAPNLFWRGVIKLGLERGIGVCLQGWEG